MEDMDQGSECYTEEAGHFVCVLGPGCPRSVARHDALRLDLAPLVLITSHLTR